MYLNLDVYPKLADETGFYGARLPDFVRKIYGKGLANFTTGMVLCLVLNIVFSSILLGTTFLHDSFKAFGWGFFQAHPMAIHGICILIVLPALLIDTLYGFAWLALVSFIAMMTSLLGLSGMMFESMSGSGVSESWKEFTVINFPRFVGSICLCLGGVTMMLPIRSELKEPESFRRVFRTSFFTSATVFILFGVVANLAFGHGIQKVLFDHFHGTKYYYIFAFESTYAVMVLVSFPMFLVNILALIRTIPCLK